MELRKIKKIDEMIESIWFIWSMESIFYAAALFFNFHSFLFENEEWMKELNEKKRSGPREQSSSTNQFL